MTELSPAAQAVALAYENAPERPIGNHRYHWLAAALRAAAYQVAPARPVLDSCCEHFEQAIRHKILAIAAELDGGVQ